MNDPLRTMRAGWKALARRWPRRFVLRGTNVPIELVHIVEHDREPQCIIRLPDGSRMRITPADLGSQPMLSDGVVGLACALALAAAVAALSISAADRGMAQEVMAMACSFPE
ncbi:hypothetical protein [Marinimicrococcus flavescens]|uniref:Uncharacterized protein n=1 Tax=Marinimicrococcus flavescens TaxID=3031815 RepID=A0AAP3XSF6_9PROT|nr:hypothetical protein [Marinimicrococcus flavescens]